MGIPLLFTPTAVTYAKAGTLAAGSVARGADVFTAAETGTCTSTTRASGEVERPLVVVYETHPPLGGVYDQTTTNGTVQEPNRGGGVVAKARGGRFEPYRSGVVREPVKSGTFDETSTGGEVL